MATYPVAPSQLTVLLRHAVGVYDLDLDYPEFEQERFSNPMDDFEYVNPVGAPDDFQDF